LILDDDRHGWSLGDLRDRLAGKGMEVDYSTVLRAMERLADDQLVERVDLLDGHVHYERRQAHHDHLACERCGAVVAIPCVLVERLLSSTEQDTGFEILDHRLVVTGRCPRCRDGESPARQLGS